MISVYLYLTLILTDFEGFNELRDVIGFSLLILVMFTVGVNCFKAIYVDSEYVMRVIIKKFLKKRLRTVKVKEI